MMQQTDIVLVQPPYLRLVGSHNDRAPLELCYLNEHLHNSGYNSVVYNADWSGAGKYIAWRKLFENFSYMEAAANGHSPLFDETVERIMTFEPRVVVLSAADNVTPWVDLGNAYTTAYLSEKLRSLGVFTVGVGPFYSEVPFKFLHSFDAIMTGMASPSIVDIIRELPRGQVIQGAPIGLDQRPRMEILPMRGRDDVVMTALGCPYTCTFCFARHTRYQPLDVNLVVADVASRSADLIDFGDAILPLQLHQLKQLAQHLAPFGKRFTCEVSVKSISERSLEALRELGVVAVKLGVESGDALQLKQMAKRQTVEGILEASALIKRFGFRFTAYVLLGGPGSTDEAVENTYDLCREIEADDYVINVWAFHDLQERDFRYDAHFSQVLVREWGLEPHMAKFFDLQKSVKFGLGALI